jgi:hypothetical protein
MSPPSGWTISIAQAIENVDFPIKVPTSAIVFGLKKIHVEKRVQIAPVVIEPVL